MSGVPFFIAGVGAGEADLDGGFSAATGVGSSSPAPTAASPSVAAAAAVSAAASAAAVTGRRLSVPSLVVDVIQPCGFSMPSSATCARRSPSGITRSLSTRTLQPTGSRPTSSDLSSNFARTSGGFSLMTLAQYGHAGRPPTPPAAPPSPLALEPGGGTGTAPAGSGTAAPVPLLLPLGYIFERSGSGMPSVAFHPCPSWSLIVSTTA